MVGCDGRYLSKTSTVSNHRIGENTILKCLLCYTLKEICLDECSILDRLFCRKAYLTLHFTKSISDW